MSQEFVCKKIRYSESGAKKVIEDAKHKKKTLKPRSYYSCVCGFYHITSKEDVEIKQFKSRINYLKAENDRIKLENEWLRGEVKKWKEVPKEEKVLIKKSDEVKIAEGEILKLRQLNNTLRKNLSEMATRLARHELLA